MRRIGTLLAAMMAGLLIAAAPGCGGSSAPESTVSAADARFARFDVEGMTCASCEVSIKLVLKKIDGVIEVSADSDAGTASARFDPAKTDPQVLAAAITKLGYTARVRPAKQGGR